MARKAAGRLVREWREAQQPKLTQDDLAKDIGKSGTYVRKLENGQLPFTVPIAISISKRTGIGIAALLSRDQIRMAHDLAAMTRPLDAA